MTPESIAILPRTPHCLRPSFHQSLSLTRDSPCQADHSPHQNCFNYVTRDVLSVSAIRTTGSKKPHGWVLSFCRPSSEYTCITGLISCEKLSFQYSMSSSPRGQDRSSAVIHHRTNMVFLSNCACITSRYTS